MAPRRQDEEPPAEATSRSHQVTASARDVATLSAEDIVPDAALGTTGADQFEHAAIAGRVADLATNAQPPINIALFGPWGSGKSSFYELLRREIRRRSDRVVTVRYDAWKYGGASLKKNFIASMARELKLKDEQFNRGLYDNHKVVKLDWRSFLKNNWKSLLWLTFVAIALCCLWVAILATSSWLTSGTAWIEAFNASLPGTVKTLGTALIAVFAGMKILDVAKITIDQTAPSADEEFGARFVELVSKATRRGRKRVLVFVDELDRCSSADVVETLVSLKTFLDQDSCVFVVAADRDVLEDALSKDLPHPSPVRDSDPYYSTAGAFIDKVFQHQLSLPPLREHTLTQYARSLVVDRGGLWNELSSARPERRLLDEVVYTLIPSHVRSPRRVKVLLNNYATNVRIGQARGISWPERATELAKLTVLQTEFPPVARDLLREPRLLQLILTGTDEDGERTDQQNRLLQKYAVTRSQNNGESPDADSAGGVILHDEEETKKQEIIRLRAQQRLNEQLLRYLQRAEAADIPDPRPDLLYLQAAGAADGIFDADLNAAIDLAADVNPANTIEAFEHCDAREVKAAMIMLASRTDSQFGPGRANLISVICHLAEKLSLDEIRPVTPAVAPSVMAAAKADLIRPSMLPGAIILGLLSSNDEIVGRLIDAAISKSARKHIPRIIPYLEIMPEALAVQMGKYLGSLYFENPEYLHQALKELPVADAVRLWKAQLASIENAFDKLATIDQSVTLSASSTPAAISAGPEPVNNSATARLDRLLDLLDEGTELNSQVIMSVLDLAIYLGHTDMYDIARRRAEIIIERVPDERLVVRTVLQALEYCPDSDWSFWISLLPSHTATSFGDVSPVLLHVLAKVPTSDSDELAVVPEIFDKVLKGGEVPTSMHGKIVTATTEAFDAVANGTILGREQRNTIHTCAGIAYELAAITEIAAVVGDYLAAETVSDELTLEDAGAILLRLSHAPFEGVRRLDAFLNETDIASLPTRLYVVRIHIAARALIGGEPLSLEEVLCLAGLDNAASVVGEWIQKRPPLDDVVKVLQEVAVPSASTLGAYASTLDNTGRSTAWTALASLGTDDRTLRSVAERGVDPNIVDRLRLQATEASRYEERTSISNRLLTLPIGQDSALHKPVCEFALMLLGRETSADAALAAKVMIATGGPAYGYAVRLRESFDAALAKSKKVYTPAIKQGLIGMRLLSKPRKGPLTIIGEALGINDD